VSADLIHQGVLVTKFIQFSKTNTDDCCCSLIFCMFGCSDCNFKHVTNTLLESLPMHSSVST